MLKGMQRRARGPRIPRRRSIPTASRAMSTHIIDQTLIDQSPINEVMHLCQRGTDDFRHAARCLALDPHSF